MRSSKTVFTTTCNRCKFQVESEIETLPEGWHVFNESDYCPTCFSNWAKNNAEAMELDSRVMCDITDESRHLAEGDILTVCDIPKGNRGKNLSVYVSVGNGWQALLHPFQYHVV